MRREGVGSDAAQQSNFNSMVVIMAVKPKGHLYGLQYHLEIHPSELEATKSRAPPSKSSIQQLLEVYNIKAKSNS